MPALAPRNDRRVAGSLCQAKQVDQGTKRYEVNSCLLLWCHQFCLQSLNDIYWATCVLDYKTGFPTFFMRRIA